MHAEPETDRNGSTRVISTRSTVLDSHKNMSIVSNLLPSSNVSPLDWLRTSSTRHCFVGLPTAQVIRDHHLGKSASSAIRARVSFHQRLATLTKTAGLIVTQSYISYLIELVYPSAAGGTRLSLESILDKLAVCNPIRGCCRTHPPHSY